MTSVQHMDWCDPECNPDEHGGHHSGIVITIGGGALTTFLAKRPEDADGLPWLVLGAQERSDALLVHGPLVPSFLLAVAQHAGRLVVPDQPDPDSYKNFLNKLLTAYSAGLIDAETPCRGGTGPQPLEKQ